MKHLFNLFFSLFPLTIPLLAQTENMQTVTVEPEQDVRALAEMYLGNPNYWQGILQANNLASSVDVKPGMTIYIPAAQLKSLNTQVKKALSAIKAATDAGAKVFTPAEIEQAYNLYKRAIDFRKSGEWENGLQLANTAIVVAENALKKTIEKRNIIGEAKLTDRQGNVDRRRPEEKTWQSAKLLDKLVEHEVVRTHSKSSAEVTFIDQSQIDLYENSHLRIQRMRIDSLEYKKESSVKFVKGSAFALLNSNQRRKKFEFSVDGVKTEIASSKFLVEKSEEETKFANYDGEMAITAKGKKVVLSKNQGSLVKKDKPPASPRDLLESPEIISPQPKAFIYKSAVTFEWSAVSGAAEYWLEISRSKSFKNPEITQKGIRATKLTLSLAEDSYYWRVAALDKDGLPSPFSKRGFFYVHIDTEAPFLYIAAPDEGALFRKSDIQIRGETDQDATIRINDRPVSVAEDGVFSLPFTLADGINELTVTAIDPAENSRALQRKVIYVADEDIKLVYDPNLPQPEPGHFIASSKNIALGGTTRARSSLLLEGLSSSLRLRTFSDNQGKFQFLLPGVQDSAYFSLYITSPAGYSREDTILVIPASAAPMISLETPLPAVTASASQPLKGHIQNAEKLTVNNIAVPFSGGAFSTTVSLQPGKNRLVFIATGATGGQAVLEKQIVLDNQPPELLSHQLLPNKSGRSSLAVEIKAADDSGLKRAAKIVLFAGDRTHQKYLKFDKTTQAYTGIIPLPEKWLANARLQSVRLEDYYGNGRDYQLQ